MKMFMKLAHSSVKPQMTAICRIVSIISQDLSEWKSAIQYREGGKKAGFDQSRLADECIQLKVANGKAWEINESEFLQLEKGKMRFMMWRHRAESCSITRFTINLNKEETAPPVAATLYWYTYFSLEPSTFQAGSPALLLLPALLRKDTLFFSFLNTWWVTEQVYTQITTALN